MTTMTEFSTTTARMGLQEINGGVSRAEKPIFTYVKMGRSKATRQRKS